MSDPCAPIQEAIQKLRQQIQQVHGSHGYIQGPHDPNPGRPDPEMLQEVRQLSALLGQKTAEYDHCVVARGGKLDLPAVLTGSLSFTATDVSTGSPLMSTQSVMIGLFFQKFDHTNFSITSFPSLSVGPYMGDTLTAMMTGGGQGTFTPATGVMTVRVTWHLHNSLWLVSDSDLTIVLSTETMMPLGSRLSPAGAITLAGTGICSGGRLAGDSVAISIAGAISPLP